MNAEDTIADAIADFTMDARHMPTHGVPIRDLRLNYEVTLRYRGAEILTTPYHMGIGHIPGVSALAEMTNSQANRVREACRTGAVGGKLIRPQLADVIYCLISDASVLDCPTFEDWARDFGYDADSRKAEQIYRQCLEIALRLKCAIGDDGLARLREAFQDY